MRINFFRTNFAHVVAVSLRAVPAYVVDRQLGRWTLDRCNIKLPYLLASELAVGLLLRAALWNAFLRPFPQFLCLSLLNFAPACRRVWFGFRCSGASMRQIERVRYSS